ncbi:hypothetical protein FOMPIDRAFT_86429 [Fomitopsis schrenkii]|uniref:Uncharacterized protein n=1 Tax=Fomitopsis schrenkii TaxID=2126942 RepID=S8F0H1_FOMSC|nr:hypothetical protein FOMPIDRAFT_86429 [Fomitopsis schrenkii]
MPPRRRRRTTTAKSNKKTKTITPPNAESTHDDAEARYGNKRRLYVGDETLKYRRPEDSLVEPFNAADRDSSNAPIHRMPPEVLKIIFEFSLARRYRYGAEEDYYDNWMYYHYNDSSSNTGTVIPWMYPVTDPFHFITISAVCRYWRIIALDTPALWNNVAPANVGPHGPRSRSDHKKFASAALTYLQRAGQRPVNLVVDRSGQAIDIEELLGILGPQISSRLREIHCHYLPKRRPINAIFDFPAPSLESLHLGHDVCVLSAFRGETYAQRKPLFNGVTPRLRYLSLAHLEDVVPKLHAPSLTHLHLHLCSLTFTKSTWVTRDLASDLLKDLPELTDLSLSMIQFYSGDRPTHPEVHFGKLRRFTLHGMKDPNYIRRVMNYLAIPSDTSILFRDCKPLTPELVIGSQGLKDYLDRRPWTRASISSQPVAGRPVSHVSVIGTDDHVGVAFDWAREHSSSEYRLRLPIPLSGAHECWIMEPADTPAALSVGELHVIFRSMAGLRTLVVCPWNAHTVVDALSDEAGPAPGVCPNLTELRVIAKNPSSIPANTLNALAALKRSRVLERVVVCYPSGPHPGAEDPERGFCLPIEVEYVHLEDPAEMELPSVCKTEAHVFWPKWQNHADVIFGE